MPRVIRILNRLAIGGPLLNASYLTKYMSPEFETMLVVGEREDHEKDAGFVTDRLGIQPVFIPEMGRSVDPRKDYIAYRKMKKLIAEFKPDIVHSHAAKPGAIGRMAASAMKVPVIVHTYHGHVFHSYFHPLKTKIFINIERALGRKTDAIVAISEQQKKELAHDFKIAPEEKFRVIQLGLDLDKFNVGREEKRQAFRSSFGIGDDVVVLTITGRLVPVKNHELFLTGIKHLLQNSRQKIKAFIVGDGETRLLLEEKCRELNIDYGTEKDTQQHQPLVFTSWREDIDCINAGSDIIALTSFNEGTPVSLIEAQAAGKPVVSTRVGGIGDVVKENESGLLSDINDTAAFCTNLLKLTEDEELRCKFGLVGEKYVTTRFGYQRLVGDMAALYHELLNRKIG